MSLSGSPNATPRSQSPAARSTASASRSSFFKRSNMDKQEAHPMKETAQVALSLAKTTVDLLKDVTGNAGVPGLSEGFAVVSQILTKVKAMSTTIKGIDELNKRIKDLSERLREFQSTSDEAKLPESLRAEIGRMMKRWEDAGAKLGGMKKRKGLLRFLRSEVDADELAGLVKVISDTLEDSLTSSVWRIERGVHGLQNRVEQIDSKVDMITAHQDDSLLPRGAEAAQYDAKNTFRNGCLEGTSQRALERIRDWVALWSSGKPTSGLIFWVNALAGMGKTTIAFTIADEYKKQGLLAGSFFFSRDDSECSDPNMVFLTLARQLCLFYPPLKQHVVDALRRDPDIVKAGPARQLEELIVRPLEKVKDDFPTSIIVLDALDECRDTSNDVSTSIILTVLADSMDRLSPLLFVFTSRRKPGISALFDPEPRGKTLVPFSTSMDLHDIGEDAASNDICHFLTRRLREVPITLKVPRGWPLDKDIITLTALAHSLFIFAATAVRFILAPGSQPVRRLECLLGMRTYQMTPYSLLHSLYEQVLRDAEPSSSDPTEAEELENELRRIVGTIVTAEEPLAIVAIAGLLELPEDDVRNSLAELHPVLHIPNDDDGPVRIIHPSFREFLVQSTPPQNIPRAFTIEPAAQHSFFLLRCFRTMQALEYDIAGLTDPLLSKKEIPNLATKIKERIPPYLSYACRRWSVHLQHIGPQTTNLFSALEDFLEHRLLHWLESCSLLEVLEGALYAPDTVRRKCESLGEPFRELTNTLDDYRRFVVKYSACIDDAPLQLYDSVLAITPRNSVVARKYGAGHKSSITVHRDAITHWGSGIDSFASHRKGTRIGIFSVAFSPDGVFFATTGVDRTIRIWRALTRTMVLVIEGLKDDVDSLAYSPDGANIVSGSKGGLVQTWDAVSGTHIRDFEGHSGKVVFVWYVADGTRIFSASSQGEVKLWDTFNGRVLFQHASPDVEWDLSEVGMSPDGALMTYYEGDALYLHNLSTQQRDALDLPDKCWATTFSSDGKRVAAATDAGIWIWSLPGKSLVCRLDVLEHPYCLAFSSDATQIACGCKDGSVRLWRPGSEGNSRIFNSHGLDSYDNKATTAVTWSPDSAMLVSVGDSGFISVWDTASPSMASSDPQRHLPGDQHPTGPARFSLFEYNGGMAIHDLPPSLEHNLTNDPGMPVIEGGPTAKLYSSCAACFCNNLVEPSPEFPLKPIDGDYPSFCWAYLIGRIHEHETGRHSPIVFSPDGTLLAYVPSDNNIRVCDLRTRTVVATLTGHTDAVRSAVFSPSGALLASGAKDRTLNIWDMLTGSLRSSHKQGATVLDVTFSSDSRFVASCAQSQGVCVVDVLTGHIMPHFPIAVPEVDMVRVALELRGEHVLALHDDNPSIYVWEISSGACVTHFSLQDNSWVASLDFSPNDTGIILNSPGYAPCALTLWNPGDRRWPAYQVDKTGWIYAQGPGYRRRLGWLPQDWRFTLCSEGTCVYVWDSSRKVVVEIDVSRALQDAGLSVTQ